ncbi:carbohydrate ABC transporter permease [Zafaria sp. J156]|uniref:carbohydrate ABC transporter permease n=1 Tax=Zafaria sp. J156 TaxID=3116490 RepID=UPI002E78F244|nr:sugar ABC transporter permease [Zafaria sp. J156]MEE1622575.1 sugar ABC transporter permease [Zafaria sp. J156]
MTVKDASGRSRATRPAGTSGSEPRRKRYLSDRGLAYLLVAPALLLILVFAVYPFGVAVLNSFNDVDINTGARTPSGLDNYVALFTDASVRDAFFRSVNWTVSNMVLQVVLGVAVAMLLNLNLKGQRLARVLVLIPYMVPAIVAALVFRFMFNDVTGVVNYGLQTLGLIDKPLNWLSDPAMMMPTLVLVNVWKYAPFFVIIVLARLQSIPRDLYEAVAIDGGGWWHRFTAVTLPSIVPVVLAGMLLRTIWTAYDFDVPFLLSNGGGPSGSAITVPLAIRALAFEQQQLGQASALAVCTAILLTGAAYFYLRGYRKSERSTD